MKYLQKYQSGLLTVLAGLVLSSPAFAAIDVTTVTDKITEAVAAVAVIGVAVLAVLVGIKAFKWVARAM